MPAARTKHEVEVEGRRLTLSNLDKVLYPSGFTKGQVIDYYVRASAHALPLIPPCSCKWRHADDELVQP